MLADSLAGLQLDVCVFLINSWEAKKTAHSLKLGRVGDRGSLKARDTRMDRL